MTALVLLMLAWRPFLDPLPLHDQWMWLIIPVAVVIAVVYKALKLEDLDHLARESIRLTLVILLAMLAAAAVLWVINAWI